MEPNIHTKHWLDNWLLSFVTDDKRTSWLKLSLHKRVTHSVDQAALLHCFLCLPNTCKSDKSKAKNSSWDGHQNVDHMPTLGQVFQLYPVPLLPHLIDLKNLGQDFLR